MSHNTFGHLFRVTTFGGLVCDYLSWRWTFFLILPLGVLAGLLAFAALNDDEKGRAVLNAIVDGPFTVVVNEKNFAPYASEAITAQPDSDVEHKVTLLVGGTMLYFRALLQGLSPMPEADPAMREMLSAEAAERGWAALHAELAKVDRDRAKMVREEARQRMLTQVSGDLRAPAIGSADEARINEVLDVLEPWGAREVRELRSELLLASERVVELIGADRSGPAEPESDDKERHDEQRGNARTPCRPTSVRSSAGYHRCLLSTERKRISLSDGRHLPWRAPRASNAPHRWSRGRPTVRSIVDRRSRRCRGAPTEPS